MATNNNLGDLLQSIANAIRSKKGTTEPINAQDFASEIESIETGGGGGGSGDVLVVPDGMKFGYSTTLLDMDTSAVTDFSVMFGTCEHILTIPSINTSNGTNFSSCFSNCYKLTAVPPLDTSKATNVNNMFGNCRALTAVPALDTSKATNMGGMFYNDWELTTIAPVDLSKATNVNNLFYRCEKLTSLTLTGSINITLSISYSPLNEASIRSVLEACSRTINTNSKTLTFKSGSTISDADGSVQTLINTCTSKGWTVQNLTIS